MADPLLDQVRQALGVPLDDVLGEVRRLVAMEAGLRAGVAVTPGMSPADVETASQAAAAFALANNWTPFK